MLCVYPVMVCALCMSSDGLHCGMYICTYAMLCVCAVSIEVFVSLTPDTSPMGGKFCPKEMVTLTCKTVNVTSTSLRWFHDGNTSISELSYLFSNDHEFPLSRNISLNGFSNYTIVNATLDQQMRTIVNFKATLVVALQELYRLQYRSVQCGSGNEKGSFSLDLDIEGE